MTYDPADVSAYYGKTFVTESGSRYGLTKDGRFTGRPSIEGTKVELIASIPVGLEIYRRIMISLWTEGNPKSKDNLRKIINEEGKEPVKGLRLLVCISDEDTERKDRNGLLTSPITKIVNTK